MAVLVAAARSASRLAERGHRRRVHEHEAAQRPGECLLDVRLVVADQLRRSGRGRAPRRSARGRGDGRRTASSRPCCRPGAAPSATASRRAARAPPSDTARRGCPCRRRGRAQSTVIQSPASRAAAGRAATFAPPRRRSSARAGRTRTSGARSPPRGGAGRPRRATCSCGRPSSPRGSPRLTASISGQRTPMTAPIPGRDPALALEVLGVGEAVQPARERGRERLRVAGELREAAAQLLGGRLVLGDERRRRAR